MSPYPILRKLALSALILWGTQIILGCRCTRYEVLLESDSLPEKYAVEVQLYFSPESDSDTTLGEPITNELRKITSKDWFKPDCNLKREIIKTRKQGQYLLYMTAIEDETSTETMPGRRGGSEDLRDKIKWIYIWANNNDQTAKVIPAENLFHRTFLWWGKKKGIVKLKVSKEEVDWTQDQV